MLVSEKYPVGSRVIMVDDWWQPSFYRECYIGKIGVVESVSTDYGEELTTFYIRFEDGELGLGCPQKYFRHLQVNDIYTPPRKQMLPNI